MNSVKGLRTVFALQDDSYSINMEKKA